ncbi:MAG: hypothetical protein GQ534_00080, partial [Candidatus Delongbacteria bacterium]|nr:hypothetical protein [Candidatus Delongbacteria bacterium]
IERYLTDTSFAKEIVNNAKESVKNYTWGTISEKLLKFYEELEKN